MSKIPYRLPRGRLLVLFALLALLLLVFQPALQSMAARVEPRVPGTQWLAARVARGWLLPERQSPILTVSGIKNAQQVKIPGLPGTKKKKVENAQNNVEILAKLLAESGPEIATAVSMRSFSVKGFVKGQWPFVIAYKLEAESTAEVTISVKGVKRPFVIKLTPTNDQRNEIEGKLPEEFGKKPQVGDISFQAFKNGPEPRTPARFFLYGLGVGDKAVGSVAIGQLRFQPDRIRPKLKEKASYSFHSSSDFDTASADFMLLTRDSAGGVQSHRAARVMLTNGVRRGKSVAMEWNGKNSDGKVSLGLHQFWVRVWRGLKSGADWVFAAHDQPVMVE